MILAAHLLLFGLGAGTYNFHRTYTTGAADTYSLEYTDTNHNNNPLIGTLTCTVKTVNPSSGGATILEVVSNGRGRPPVHNQNPADPSVNSTTLVEFESSGIPLWSGSAVPSRTSVDLMNLGMAALKSGLTMGLPTPFTVLTVGGATRASFSGKVTLTAVAPNPQFHVVGDVALGAGGASITHFDGTYIVDGPTSRVTQSLYSANIGSRAFTAKINLMP
jgi:hypothetical protein